MQIEINRTEIRNKLKAEIGVQDVPDEELINHKVIFNSPTGRDEGLTMTAHDYVELGFADYVASIEQVNAQMADKDFFKEYLPDAITPIQLPIPQKVTFDPTKVKYVQTSHDTQRFVVCVNLEQEDGEEQMLKLKTSPTFICERESDSLTAFDNVISFYQWHNWAANLDRKVSTDVLDVNDLHSKINFMFEGLEGLDVAEGFMR